MGIRLWRMVALDLSLATPRLDLGPTDDPALASAQGLISRRAVGGAAAMFFKGKLAGGSLTVGVS